MVGIDRKHKGFRPGRLMSGIRAEPLEGVKRKAGWRGLAGLRRASTSLKDGFCETGFV